MHGVLLLDKPRGLSSNDALQKCKWLLRAEKAGHTGTLDPLATGVLPLCFGAATKFSQLQLDADKTYEAIAQLGVRTSTGDAEGEVLARQHVSMPTNADLAAVAARLSGPQQQVPPMHSALKKDGRPLYEFARQGIEVERTPRDIVVHRLQLAPADEPWPQPSVHLFARVSKGTYIRTLGESVGDALGCGAHLRMLRRVGTGGFDIARCVTLDDFSAMDETRRLRQLQPVDALLDSHDRITLGPEDAGRFLSGLRRRGVWADAAQVAVYGSHPQALLGTAHVRAGELIPLRLLSPLEIAQILEQTAETTP